MSAFQATFSISENAVGTLDEACPSAVGPRNSGQFSAWQSTAAIITRCNAIKESRMSSTLLILDTGFDAGWRSLRRSLPRHRDGRPGFDPKKLAGRFANHAKFQQAGFAHHCQERERWLVMVGWKNPGCRMSIAFDGNGFVARDFCQFVCGNVRYQIARFGNCYDFTLKLASQTNSPENKRPRRLYKPDEEGPSLQVTRIFQDNSAGISCSGDCSRGSARVMRRTVEDAL